VVSLLHNAGTPSKPVIKAVRYGITLLALPSEEPVKLVGRVIAKQCEHPYEPQWPFWAE